MFDTASVIYYLLHLTSVSITQRNMFIFYSCILCAYRNLPKVYISQRHTPYDHLCVYIVHKDVKSEYTSIHIYQQYYYLTASENIRCQSGNGNFAPIAPLDSYVYINTA